MEEQALPGHAISGVVRVGDTVRRPVGVWTDAVDAVLTHLQAVGFTGAPRPLGRDAQGRQVLEFVPGAAGEASPTYSLAQLRSIGQALAEVHGALAPFTAPPGAVWNQLIPPDARAWSTCWRGARASACPRGRAWTSRTAPLARHRGPPASQHRGVGGRAGVNG